MDITLNNGVEMPALGFGVFQVPAETAAEGTTATEDTTGTAATETTATEETTGDTEADAGGGGGEYGLIDGVYVGADDLVLDPAGS